MMWYRICFTAPMFVPNLGYRSAGQTALVEAENEYDAATRLGELRSELHSHAISMFYELSPQLISDADLIVGKGYVII